MNERGQYGRSRDSHIGADTPTMKSTSNKNSMSALLVLAGILGGGVLANLFFSIREARKPHAPYYPTELARRDAERAARMTEAEREAEARRDSEKAERWAKTVREVEARRT